MKYFQFWILSPNIGQLRHIVSDYSRHNIGSRDTDLDTFYTNNSNVRLLLNLLVSSSGLGRPLRCLALLDDDFHEACCPRILVRIELLRLLLMKMSPFLGNKK